MKIKLLLTALIAFSFAAVPTFAGITPSEASSVDYLKNHGHSTHMVEIVQQNKAGTNGETYTTLDEKKHENDSLPVKWVRKFLIYFDPAYDDGRFLKHDISPAPKTDDL